jgi:hypothetical protein
MARTQRKTEGAGQPDSELAHIDEIPHPQSKLARIAEAVRDDLADLAEDIEPIVTQAAIVVLLLLGAVAGVGAP